MNFPRRKNTCQKQGICSASVSYTHLKAYALLQGRDFVTPEDIKFVAPYVLQHRLILTAEAEMEGYSPVKAVSYTHLGNEVSRFVLPVCMFGCQDEG